MMSPELLDYKTQTYHQLEAVLPQLEADLTQTTDPALARRLSKQIQAIRLHQQRLYHELATETEGEPVASELFLKAARAMVKEKFYMAQKSLNELETIEPFYPGLSRLKKEVETRKVSRNTRSIAEGMTPAFVLTASRPTLPVGGTPDGTSVAGADVPFAEPVAEETGGWLSNIFQFHIMASCLVVFGLFCSMAAVGGTALLEYIIEGL